GKGAFHAFALMALASVLIAGRSPSTPDDLVASARESAAKEDYQAARIHLKNALKSDSSFPEARFLCGQILFQIGDVAGAVVELRRAKSFGYPADEVNKVLARVLVERGEYRKAIEEFAGLQPAKPEDQAVLYTAVGQARMALGAHSEAQANFDAALAAQPTYA